METKNIQKRKKPAFVRQGGKRLKRLAKVWRRPRGIHSKARRKFKGHEKQPSIGYGSNSLLKGLNRSGLRERVVKSLSDLNNIKSGSEAGMLYSKLGMRKRVIILKKAKELNLPINNIKNIDDYLRMVEDNLSKRKAEVKKKLEERKSSKDKAAREAEDKKIKEKKKDDSKKEETKKAIEGLENKAEPNLNEAQPKQVSQDTTKNVQRRIASN